MGSTQAKDKLSKALSDRQNNESETTGQDGRVSPIVGHPPSLFCVSAKEVRTTRQRTDQENFWKFTDEEMETSKNTDLPDLLEHLGYHLKRQGRYYSTAEMDSLMIKNRRTWKRYSNGKGGDAITFLQEFEGKGFREAVDYLLEFNGRIAPAISRPRAPPEEEKPVEFALPPANGDNRRVFGYLRKRGIAPQVIRAFLNTGLLYEEEKHHNAVLVGRDGDGVPKFACKRGPTTGMAPASSGMCWAATRALPSPSPATPPSPGCWSSRPPST